jgi:hypothetical protein
MMSKLPRHGGFSGVQPEQEQPEEASKGTLYILYIYIYICAYDVTFQTAVTSGLKLAWYESLYFSCR